MFSYIRGGSFSPPIFEIRGAALPLQSLIIFQLHNFPNCIFRKLNFSHLTYIHYLIFIPSQIIYTQKYIHHLTEFFPVVPTGKKIASTERWVVRHPRQTFLLPLPSSISSLISSLFPPLSSLIYFNSLLLTFFRFNPSSSLPPYLPSSLFPSHALYSPSLFFPYLYSPK